MDMHAILIVVVICISENFADKRFILPSKTYDQWSAWSQCLGPCGGTGTRHRTRGCSLNLFTIIQFSAECQREDKQVEHCIALCQQTTKAVLPAYPIGMWSSWGMFSSCDKTCGGGVQIRHRVCSGGSCVGDSLESASCNSNQCPGKWGEWGLFSSCDKTCGSGIQIRRRVCSLGTCIGDSLEAASCNDRDCPDKTMTTKPAELTKLTQPTTHHYIFITIKSK
uniref:A disintegrin and metalloproteinase with thrombospondin motifs adt-2-like n=1 Tax=Crassostrea virginica TaxID=6565 RepID=A0A8B8E5B4_CRAVI|nr:A disintegrin and metalloproteinase with thrombospondin motifs adt-2-like [Crassostrea virginica]